MTDFLAHTRPNERAGHPLRDHLTSVAALAGQFAEPLNSHDWAFLAGLWHDLGKYRPGFQNYIRMTGDAHIEGKLPANSDKTHSAAGALHALRALPQRWGDSFAALARVLSYLIAGHHAGLGDWVTGVGPRLLGSGAQHCENEYREAIAACEAAAPDLLAVPAGFDLQRALAAIPGPRLPQPLTTSLWIRMLFSALVDADFLDTERFMDESKSALRRGAPPIDSYLEQLEAHLAAKAADVARQGLANEPVMQARTEVLRLCRAKAALAPGVFTLTVPTGGGKTLSSLAFALRHAKAHGKCRVIYAIPYTSIIEQTADVFAAIFGTDNVIEHHSQAGGDDRGETARSRLASENWDAPLIVTTNVQLFESLFAARTSRCRKLHNIADSVIVLDEAQLLPPEFLQPILDALDVLAAHFGVTLLLCTATQPVLVDTARFDPRQRLRGLPPPTRIIDNEAALFATLRRARIEWPADLHTAVATDALVARLALHPCVLVIVNTRRDAAEIATALDAATGDKTLHLSAAMCGQHRADVIAEVRDRLAARRAGSDLRPLRVVSTQLVEAGVDIDFPIVFRALAGLDSIAQAAGRCNREGLLAQGGEVVVFVREIPKALHALRNGAEAARGIVASGGDAFAPDAFERYFPLYYAAFHSRDKHGIVDRLKKNASFEFEFRTAAEKFKLIDDEDQATLIVPYARAGMETIAPLIARLRQGDTDRWLLRKLQRYTVSARRRQIDAWAAQGGVQELGAGQGLYLLTDDLRYDARFGLLPQGRPLDASSLVQ